MKSDQNKNVLIIARCCGKPTAQRIFLIKLLINYPIKMLKILLWEKKCGWTNDR